MKFLPEWLRHRVYERAKRESCDPKWKVFLVTPRNKMLFRDGFVTGAMFGYNQTIRHIGTTRQKESSK